MNLPMTEDGLSSLMHDDSFQVRHNSQLATLSVWTVPLHSLLMVRGQAALQQPSALLMPRIKVWHRLIRSVMLL